MNGFLYYIERILNKKQKEVILTEKEIDRLRAAMDGLVYRNSDGLTTRATMHVDTLEKYGQFIFDLKKHTIHLKNNNQPIDYKIKRPQED